MASMEPVRVMLVEPEEDVVHLLLADHASTRVRLRRAWNLARATGPDPGAAHVAHAMQAFFRYWNPLHELDEEQIVLPALAAYASDPASCEVLDRVIQEHLRMDDIRDKLGRIWDDLAAEPAALEDLRDELRRCTKSLVRTMASHGAWEEREVFPRIRRFVPAEVQRRVLAVIRERRAASRASVPPVR